jgi:hypothetical protein
LATLGNRRAVRTWSSAGRELWKRCAAVAAGMILVYLFVALLGA